MRRRLRSARRDGVLGRLRSRRMGDAEGIVATLGVSAIFLLGLVLLGIGQVPSGEQFECSAGSTAGGIVILIDTTDQLPEHQAIARMLGDRIAAVPPAARVEVGALGDVSARAFRPVFQGCMPAEAFTRNPKMVARERGALTEAALAAVDRILDETESRGRSRILESAGQASIQSPGSEVLVVTDGLENSGLFRSYDEESTPASIQGDIVDALEASKLTLVLVIREGDLMERQEQAIREFWTLVLREVPNSSLETL